jgi:hypothetical protein
VKKLPVHHVRSDAACRDQKMLETSRYPLWRIPMPHRRNGRIVMFLFCLFSLISTARPVSAEVTRIEFTSKQPCTFRAGDYVIWQGKIRGVR